MSCLDCHPDPTPAVAVCGRCGAGLCAEHLVKSDQHLTFRMPVNVQVASSPPARKLRCECCKPVFCCAVPGALDALGWR